MFHNCKVLNSQRFLRSDSRKSKASLFRGSVPFDIRFKTATEKFVYCAGSVTNGNTTTTWRITDISVLFNSVAFYSGIVWSGWIIWWKIIMFKENSFQFKLRIFTISRNFQNFIIIHQHPRKPCAPCTHQTKSTLSTRESYFENWNNNK